MRKTVKVSTPSRICLFGEHQDYLGLEVIASAINLRFYATIENRDDSIIHLKLKGENIEIEKNIDISKEIIYENNRDYLSSTINVLLRNGYKIDNGLNINMESEIPIGKGMSSSTTMIVVLIKAILEMIDSEDKNNAKKIAELGFKAEVLEFNEPGGMMDHYSSAVGGLIHINFANNETKIERIDKTLKGKFILFDSLEDKDTTRVLREAKTPVMEALNYLRPFGIESVRDFIENDEKMKLLDKLDDKRRIKLKAAIENHKILLEAKVLLESQDFNMIRFGELLKKQHTNLRDALNISTPKIEKILEIAYENGALGGKINGSGGGGCCFVYAEDEKCEKILKAVKEIGYLGIILSQDKGVVLES